MADALVRRRIEEGAATVGSLLEGGLPERIAAAAAAVVDALRGGGKVLLFGNGGSAADAQHIAAELVGRFALDRRALPALALVANSSAVTAIGNDLGFDEVFARQVEALGAPGDVAVGISTSGGSENVLRGLAAARGGGLVTVVLTGEGGRLADVADHYLAVPSASTARVQECHILIGHVLCELVEAELASA